MENMNEKVSANDALAASTGKSAAIAENVSAHGKYTVTCTAPVEHRRAEYIRLRDRLWALKGSRSKIVGAIKRMLLAPLIADLETRLSFIPMQEKWSESFSNLVTTAGKNHLLESELSGVNYTATWYIGLCSATTTPAAADTMSSHAGWTENQNYSQSTRVAPSFAAAASGSKATSAVAVFSINANTQSIDGVFLNSVSTKGGTSGTLYSVGTFTAKALNNSDTLNVSYTAGA